MTCQSVTCRFATEVAYAPTLAWMQDFTRDRDEDTMDHILFLEHEPVYTLGLKGSEEHLLQQVPSLIRSDRGGEITYHGPGQLVIYLLIDLRRKQWLLHDFIERTTQWVSQSLMQLGIHSQYLQENPGLYVDDGGKIASVGFRVKRHCSYHGIAINIEDLRQPFAAINPCGHPGMSMTCVRRYHPGITLEGVVALLKSQLLQALCYDALVEG